MTVMSICFILSCTPCIFEKLRLDDNNNDISMNDLVPCRVISWDHCSMVASAWGMPTRFLHFPASTGSTVLVIARMHIQWVELQVSLWRVIDGEVDPR